MRRRIAQVLMIGLLIVGFGAAQGPNNSEASSAPIRAVPAKPENRNQTGKHLPYQIGTASWYGDYFQGRPTASGEPYNMYDLTAAHPTLPLGIGPVTRRSLLRRWAIHFGVAIGIQGSKPSGSELDQQVWLS